MNLGNNKSSSLKFRRIDDFIERLNIGLSRLLGKSKHTSTPPTPETSNTTFTIIIVCSCILLWCCTGFYFLGESEYGLILANGKIVDVRHGIRVGFTLPYPLGNIKIIDGAPSHIFTIGAARDNSFIVLDKNLVPVSVTAKFGYQITNPKILYQNHLQQQDGFDNEILWQVQSKIKNIIALKSITELKAANFTVLSKEISAALDSTLIPYGISLNKFSIVNIQELNPIVSKESSVIIPLKQMDGQLSDERHFTRAVKRDRDWMDD